MGKTIKAEIQPNVIVRGKGQRLSKRADATLKAWARQYRRSDLLEIKKLTGSPHGAPSKRIGFRFEEDEGNRITGVVASLKPFNYQFIVRHYISRMDSMSVLYDKLRQNDSETDRHYKARIMAKYIEACGVCRRTYDRQLAKAQDEFIARGGI